MGDGSHFPSGLLLIDGLVPPVPASPPYNTRAESQLEPSDSSLASQPCITGQLRPLPSAPSLSVNVSSVPGAWLRAGRWGEG